MYFLQLQMNFTGDQCSTKWKNLHRGYKKYVDNSKTTGTAALSTPTRYKEIHALLHDSHAVNPRNILDSGATEVKYLSLPHMYYQLQIRPVFWETPHRMISFDISYN